MATQVKRVNTLGGKMQGVMPSKYKNCHMRLDRLASNVYGQYTGIALDGLPHNSYVTSPVITSPTVASNMVS